MNPDTVILDIDGVLVDVSNSYRQAIIDTISYRYDAGELITDRLIQRLKNAGGFNNDWLLTDAAALYVLTCEFYSMSGHEFTEAIAARGGGLSAAQSFLSEELDEDAWRSIKHRWDQAKHREIFQTFYLGTELYREFESNTPPFEAPGYIYDEPILLDAETRDWLTDTVPVGICTGRPAAEATIAMERIGLEIPSAHCFTMDDWDNGKPDPSALIILADRLDSNEIIFVGDTLDDVHTATNAMDADTDRQYYAIGVLTGGLSGSQGRQAFRSAGASDVINSVNHISTLL